MELLEEQIKITERIQREAQEREQALMNALEKQERVFMSKLKQLCEIEPTEKEQESELEKRLANLEMSFKTFRMKYQIDHTNLSNQLKELVELLSKE